MKCARSADAYARRLKGAAREYATAYLAALRGRAVAPNPADFYTLGQDRRASIRERLVTACAGGGDLPRATPRKAQGDYPGGFNVPYGRKRKV